MKNKDNLIKIIDMQKMKGMTEGKLLSKINDMMTTTAGASTGMAIGN